MVKIVKKRKLISKSTPPSDDPSSTSAGDEDLSLAAATTGPPPAAIDAEEPPPAATDVPQPKAEPTPMTEDPIAPEGSQSPPSEANGTADPPLEPNSKPEPEPDLEPEPTRDLLEPLAKDQLVELLLRATSRHPDVLDEIRDVAGSDPVNRKVFVHGFSWDTSTENLLSIFSQFGEVEDCHAVQNKATGKSKGYGFVLFKHRSGARKALKEPQKMIGNRTAYCQLASLGPIPAALPASENTQRKIYVSNVSADIDPHKLTQFFAKFGEIEEGPLGLDKQTGKPKGFCLFVYKAAEGARKALEEPYRNFEGHLLHCQKAIDGPKTSKIEGSWGAQQLSGGYHGSNLHAKSIVGYGSGVVSQITPLGTGHLMAPSQPTVGYNPITQQASAAINPTFEQALTALLTTPNAGIGLTNILGSLGSLGQVPSQALLPHGGYGNQAAGLGGGYVGQPYAAGRGHPGGYHGGGPRPPYMGR